MKKLRWFTLILLVCIQSHNIVNGEEVETYDSTSAEEQVDVYDINYTKSEVDLASFSYTQDNYQFEGLGYYYARKIDFKKEGLYVTSFYMPGDNGLIRYFDNGELIEKPLYEGYLPMGTSIFLETDDYSYLLGQAYTYRDLGDGTVDSLNKELPIKLSKVKGKWLITYRYTMIEGSYGVLWGLGSFDKLMDFESETNKLLWGGYDMDLNARILQDGYYYKSPTSYTPSTASSYWRIPSMYLPSALIRNGGSLASDMLGQSLLLIGAKNISSQGFLASLPKSEWLFKDYSIGKNFFDTRFNADMIETYIKAYRNFGQKDFRDAYIRLSDYYIKHIVNQHLLVSNDETRGWLVEDYNNDEVDVQTHSSLNHQLEAIHILLLLYEDEQQVDYYDYAMIMLEGIKLTRDSWIMPNYNLEYAYLPDGSMGFVDYPYLTYNDLYKVQEDLVRIRGTRDEDLDILMGAKRAWMDNEGVTRYTK